MVTVVYKIGLEIWGPPLPQKLAAQKCHNFGAISDNFAYLLTLPSTPVLDKVLEQ